MAKYYRACAEVYVFSTLEKLFQLFSDQKENGVYRNTIKMKRETCD